MIGDVISTGGLRMDATYFPKQSQKQKVRFLKAMKDLHMQQKNLNQETLCVNMLLA